jgi:hypothetical protein
MGAGPQARSPQPLMIDRHAVADCPRTWTVRQIIDTLKAIRDFAIVASVDLDASDAPASWSSAPRGSHQPASRPETSDRSELSSAMSGLRVCGDIPARLRLPVVYTCPLRPNQR